MFDALSDNPMVAVLAGPALAAIGLIFLLALIRAYRFICRPNEVLIFSGKQHKRADGSVRGYKVITGGGAWRVPIIERVERMDMRLMELHLTVQNAYSRGNIPLRLSAVANVKISSEPGVVDNAIERFLGRDRREIQNVAGMTLEGHLRGVIAQLTPEEVNEDRLKFAESLREQVEEDLKKLGLHLDTLKIQHVDDDKEYLVSIGRRRIAQVVSDAEQAESNARNEAKKAEAEAKQAGEVARENASRFIVQRKNELRKVQADLDARGKSEEEMAAAAAEQARAEAEQELQQLRAQVEGKRLQADVVIPAESDRTAKELIAKGMAAPIAENGKAQAEATRLVAEAWLAAGADAKQIYLVQQIENLVKIVTDHVNNLKVGEVNLLDGGDGTALPAYVRSFPAIITAVLSEVRKSTGVDIPALLGVAAGPTGAGIIGGGAAAAGR
ncbi:MAG TPA: SPFH domain-containing protein [Myxococcota bacterium]|jgi:flotillin|nr:SPFH domain-containing protein [Myxococcota bacterium]